MGQLSGRGPLKAEQPGTPHPPRRLSRRAIGRRGRKRSFATIARELVALVRWIRTLFYCLRVICSLYHPTEPTVHNSVIILDLVEPSTYGCGGHRQSADVDKKFGQLKKQAIFRYAKPCTCRFRESADNEHRDRHCSSLWGRTARKARQEASEDNSRSDCHGTAKR